MTKNKIFIVFFILASFFAVAQEEKDTAAIEIINANTIFHTEELPPGVNVLLGEVELYHDSATMYCDSAILDQKNRIFNAFGNVHIVKLRNSDTIELWGDTLYYDGIKKFAKIRSNVVLRKDTTTLFTDSLDYDMQTNIGKYFYKGLTINGKDSLSSRLGYLYADEDLLFFKDSVVIKNPRFKILTDTMKYDINRSVSYFFGPTEIFSDTNYLYAEFGYYDSERNLASVSRNAYFLSGPNKLFADSIFYNRNTGWGEGFGNVKIIDTAEMLFLFANYGKLNEKTQYSLITDSALFMYVYDADTLWLHSDTLISQLDTIYEDIDTSLNRKIFAFHHVKIFRRDIQVKCDSMVSESRDSVLKLYGRPVIWSDSNQVVANYAELYFYNQAPDYLYLKDSVFFSQMVDSLHFNQVKASLAEGWFKGNYLSRLLALEKIKVLYFILNDANKPYAIATLETDTMWVYLKKSVISLVVPLGKSNGELIPPKEATSLFLNGFEWYDYFRPMKPEDVFIWRKEK